VNHLTEIIDHIKETQADLDLERTCFAMELEAMTAGVVRARLEQIAARIELSPAATSQIIDHWEARAVALNHARIILEMLREANDHN
jgi:hypothetical protein